ncbi:hypothetical protein K0M31_015910 [Melipona bicolor]|uniref:Uncharacterized protein n=1 Tax=Melipona bicolor TaxID=60889 RepID=A0AA40G5Z4_9HYME|nr:hypothetical protein K0M31_015910 [Melipona bicolor]
MTILRQLVYTAEYQKKQHNFRKKSKHRHNRDFSEKIESPKIGSKRLERQLATVLSVNDESDFRLRRMGGWPQPAALSPPNFTSGGSFYKPSLIAVNPGNCLPVLRDARGTGSG